MVVHHTSVAPGVLDYNSFTTSCKSYHSISYLLLNFLIYLGISALPRLPLSMAIDCYQNFVPEINPHFVTHFSLTINFENILQNILMYVEPIKRICYFAFGCFLCFV